MDIEERYGERAASSRSTGELLRLLGTGGLIRDAGVDRGDADASPDMWARSTLGITTPACS